MPCFQAGYVTNNYHLAFPWKPLGFWGNHHRLVGNFVDTLDWPLFEDPRHWGSLHAGLRARDFGRYRGSLDVRCQAGDCIDPTIEYCDRFSINRSRRVAGL